jgi:hypothetical protein
MILETIRRIRSYLIDGYYLSATVVDIPNDLMTGTLFATSQAGLEIPVYQTETPVARQVFLDEMASLETRLQQPWFETLAEATQIPDPE